LKKTFHITKKYRSGKKILILGIAETKPALQIENRILRAQVQDTRGAEAILAGRQKESVGMKEELNR
jgi:RPA family protein